MDRRRFGGAAVLAAAAALRSSRTAPARAAVAAPAGQAATPAPEARSLPAVAVGLGLGQAYAVAPAAERTLTVRFVAVENDSRCPVSEGNVCIWEGEATVVVEVDSGGGAAPEGARFAMIAGDVFHAAWGHRGLGLLVVAVGLSGDGATPREDLVLDLVVLPDWPGGG